MKNETIMLIGVLIAAVIVLRSKKATTTTASPINPVLPVQATFANGNIIDTGTGTIFDPLTGNYTDIYTGKIIFGGGA